MGAGAGWGGAGRCGLRRKPDGFAERLQKFTLPRVPALPADFPGSPETSWQARGESGHCVNFLVAGSPCPPPAAAEGAGVNFPFTIDSPGHQVLCQTEWWPPRRYELSEPASGISSGKRVFMDVIKDLQMRSPWILGADPTSSDWCLDKEGETHPVQKATWRGDWGWGDPGAARSWWSEVL